MAAPTIATNSGIGSPAASGITAVLPTHAADDVLLACYGYSYHSATWSTPSGWTLLQAQGGLAVFYKKATSSSETDPTSTYNAAGSAGWFTCALTGAEDPATQAPEVAGASGGYNKYPDPPSVTPTGGSKDYRWVVMETNSDGRRTCDNGPSGYDGTNNLQETYDTGVGSAGGTGGMSSRAYTGSSEDPGTFTLSNSSNWDAVTIAIHPAAAAAARRVMVVS